MSNLERKISAVKREARDMSLAADVLVDLDRSDFDKKYYPLLQDIMDLEQKVDIKVDVDGYRDAKKKLEEIQDSVPNTNNIYFNLKATDKFSKHFDKLDRRILGSKLLLQELNNTKVSIDVESELPDFMKDMKDVIKESKKTSKKVKVEVPVVVGRWQGALNDFRNTMSKFANISRNVGELMQHYLVGNLLSALPAVVPVIASVGAMLGSLLPIIGTLGGAAAGIGTSFGLAGIGAVAAGALMTSALGDVFDVSEEQVKLNKKLAQTTDVKERKKIMEELAGLQGSLNKKQVEALDSLNEMKGIWGGIAKSLAPQSIGVFITLMDTLSQSLTALEPTFKSVIGHAQNLADFLNMQIESDDMKEFFDFLATTAGPTFETIGKAAINFGIGLLNMMEAFGPLSTLMSDGFLKMSESFREWAANLSESDKFQSFMDYVAENLPKLGTIFEGFITGVAGMGEAFAPFTADMLTGLADMMTKFGEWGQALSENQGFKDFIAYVQENGPALMDFFGEFVDFLINLGQAFEDIGPFMVDFSTAMLDIANYLMDANPEATKFAAAVTAIGVAILLHLPSFLLLKGAIKALSPASKDSGEKVGGLGTKISGLGTKIKGVLVFIGRMAAGLATLLGPIGWIGLAVAGLATLIYMYWDEIVAWTKKTWDKFVKFCTDGLEDVLRAVGRFAPKILNVFDGINLYDSGVKIIKSVISGITSMIGAVGRAAGKVASKISGFFPHSPAKEGALSNLDHLDFKGPVVKSLNRDATGINRAMSNLLVAPELNAEGYGAARSSYSARSAGYTKQQSAQEMAEAYANIVIQSSDVVMSGEKVGQMTWKSTTRNAERDKRQREIFEGRGRI
jgi:hypothetical protein